MAKVTSKPPDATPRTDAATAAPTPAKTAPAADPAPKKSHGWLPNPFASVAKDVRSTVDSLKGSVVKDLSGAYNDVKNVLDVADLAVSNALGPELSKVGFSIDSKPGPAPVLKEPVVMIPGFTMDASSYDPMAQHLASQKANGPVVVYTAADGQFHQGSASGPRLTAEQVKQAKIFELQYSDPNGPSVDPSKVGNLSAPSGKAAQIAAAMSAIQAATGQGKVDVVAHSAGCTDFRAYLESRHDGPQIGQAILVGPASHGTAMGNVGAIAGGAFGLSQGGAELALGSPLIRSLNQTWSHQRAQIQGQVTIVGVTGAPTPGPGGITNGDGFMPVDQVGMPGAKTVVLKGLDPTPLSHLTEIGKGGVISVVDQALGQ